MRSKTAEAIIADTSIDVYIKNAIYAYFLMKYHGSFFIPISEEGLEYEEIMSINNAASEEAKPIIKVVLDSVKEWHEDQEKYKEYKNTKI